MKKWIGGMILGAVLTSTTVVGASAPTLSVTDASPVKYTFNGVSTTLPQGYTTLSYQDHNYVPARFVAEQLGASVTWDDATQTVSIKSDDNLVGDLQAKNTDLQNQVAQLQAQVDQLKQSQTATGTTSSSATAPFAQFDSTDSHTKELNGGISNQYNFEGVNLVMNTVPIRAYLLQGQVRNISKSTITPTKMTFIAYDYQNNVVNSSTTPWFNPLAPNEIKPFVMTIPTPQATIDHYVIQLQ